MTKKIFESGDFNFWIFQEILDSENSQNLNLSFSLSHTFREYKIEKF